MWSAKLAASGLAVACVLGLGTSSQAQMTPISATGWNRDIVVERTATTPFASFAQSFDVPNNYGFYESGLAGGTKGFPAGGAFTSVLDNQTQVQLQPFNGPNALFLNSTSGTGTLTLLPAAQRPYNRIAIFASSANANGTATGQVTITFSDNSTAGPVSYNAFDWFFVTTNNAVNNLGRLALTGAFDDGSAGNPRLYQTTIDLTATGLNVNTKTVVSLTFTRPAINANTTTVVMAISGEANSVLPGVCCQNDGTCAITSQAACSGSFLSSSSSCSPNPCPQPIACCFADGHCTILQASVCLQQSGSGQAPGSTCSPNTCPQPGACCFDDGHCTVSLAAACTTNFLGASTVCSPNPCPQLSWACCLSDGSCLDLTQVACASHGGTWRPSSHCGGQTFCPPPNLIANPGAETGDLSNWVLDQNGGNGWSATFDDVVHSGNNAFSTSYGLATRHQTIDLIAAGFTPELLDSAPPVAFSEWVATRFDQAGQYFVRFELLDANMQVIQFFEHGTQDALIQIPALTTYFQESQTFTGYGPGLRFLNFIDGGRDQSGWAGNYGVHFDDALAALVLPSACCLPNGTCSSIDQATCISGGGTVQPAGTACSPNPCSGATTGACCCGSHCSITTAAACSGSNRTFNGAASSCTPFNISTPCCRGDYNKTGPTPSVQDIFDFLTGYFNGDLCADTNDSGGVSVQDIFDFLTAYFGGGCA